MSLFTEIPCDRFRPGGIGVDELGDLLPSRYWRRRSLSTRLATSEGRHCVLVRMEWDPFQGAQMRCLEALLLSAVTTRLLLSAFERCLVGLSRSVPIHVPFTICLPFRFSFAIRPYSGHDP